MQAWHEQISAIAWRTKWGLWRVFWRIRLGLAPHGSRGEWLGRRVLGGLRVGRDEGLQALLVKISQQISARFSQKRRLRTALRVLMREDDWPSRPNQYDHAIDRESRIDISKPDEKHTLSSTWISSDKRPECLISVIMSRPQSLEKGFVEYQGVFKDFFRTVKRQVVQNRLAPSLQNWSSYFETFLRHESFLLSLICCLRIWSAICPRSYVC